MVVRRRRATWGDLHDVHVVDAAGPLEVDNGAFTAFALPAAQLEGVEILDVEPRDDRRPLRLLPLLIGVDLFERFEGRRRVGYGAHVSGHTTPRESPILHSES